MQVIADGFPERTDLSRARRRARPGSPSGLTACCTSPTRRATASPPFPNALFRQSPLGGGGITVAKGGYLNNPLGLELAPNGDILDGQRQRRQHRRDDAVRREFQPFDTGAGGGGLFGLTLAQNLPGRATSSTTPKTRWTCCTDAAAPEPAAAQAAGPDGRLHASLAVPTPAHASAGGRSARSAHRQRRRPR